MAIPETPVDRVRSEGRAFAHSVVDTPQRAFLRPKTLSKQSATRGMPPCWMRMEGVLCCRPKMNLPSLDSTLARSRGTTPIAPQASIPVLGAICRSCEAGTSVSESATISHCVSIYYCYINSFAPPSSMRFICATHQLTPQPATEEPNAMVKIYEVAPIEPFGNILISYRL